uniref:Ovule protein n=1 Tax=Romanomermis culicivorax TaxID=13658 RepID=A0A915IIQ4_ROMCU
MQDKPIIQQTIKLLKSSTADAPDSMIKFNQGRSCQKLWRSCFCIDLNKKSRHTLIKEICSKNNLDEFNKSK